MYCSLDGLTISDINFIGGGFSSIGPDVCGHLADMIFIQIKQGHLGTFTGETFGDGCPNAFSGSGDNGSFIC